MEAFQDIIAREEERDLLLKLHAKQSSELISITGRRRVGKTFLVDKLFTDSIVFKVTGSQDGLKSAQLNIFGRELSRVTGKPLTECIPKDWQFAFFALEDYLRSISPTQKPVLFFDELPWLATAKSKFLTFFGHFWNTYAERQNILVIICGSAASWMINKVVRHRGGLHNRITQRIQLEPFTLLETKNYLRSKKINFPDYDIAELYMAIGGIPFYLNQLTFGKSVAQNIDRIAFSLNGALNDEFDRLYPALFDHSERHIDIVRALSHHYYGLDRKQIIKASSSTDGGRLTKTLEELEFSGFIYGFYAFDKKKRYKRYRLIDEYSNFYLNFVEPNKREGEGTWQRLREKQQYLSWRGYAFENLGLRHIQQLKAALGISSVYTSTSTYYNKGNDSTPGVQVDLVIERADRVINLCEFKFYNKQITLTKKLLDDLRRQQESFRLLTGTRQHLITTLVSPYGADMSNNSAGLIGQSVELEDLFS